MTRLHLHLVSDSTGETLESVAKACLAQFEGVQAVKHFWPMIRSERQIERVMEEIAQRPGLVLFTLVNPAARDRLQSRCLQMGLPAISVLDPVLQALSQTLGQTARGLPGRQHLMDAAYFNRIEAMHFTMAHDDGQSAETLNEADIVLLGVSRTSKTPTSIYLANRGYKTANVPVVPSIPLPESVFRLTRPLVIGLTTSAERLVQIRRNRLLTLNQSTDSDYVREDEVTAEITFARRLFTQHGWPVIDVTRRSIEETAAAILNYLAQRQEALNGNGNGSGNGK
ncbi:pyruvate, water dikinase regulatory protein [Pedomonas mirosovicensis]|uniref:pyruvate, water dikinase regulatory protein n=1 Tax=Pedomonas mirosovicensis TaxID=2908641 RepID=UPI002167357B|nr:pyruvate, water dikinase regulatory protein [Pedomonas mirosovicensis]MCH8684102.1 kinase/pyrophosphorylase [Pedomonas mirosovicensis]